MDLRLGVRWRRLERTAMLTAETIAEARRAVRTARGQGRRVGLVPTMGALHEGHLSLMAAARAECEFVAVSIFVNPIQFGPNEDYQRYPRPIERDLAACREAGVDLVFAPSAGEMYRQERLTSVVVRGMTEGLCGRQRPGHFEGVTTVVAKLFNILDPDAAYFGEKDAQQALVLRKMVVDLDFPIAMRFCPTVREADGLALSSRNAYLSADERERALCLSRGLEAGRRMIAEGRTEAAAIAAAMRRIIEAAEPEKIDYIEIVDPHTLGPVARVAGPVLMATAVRIGRTRLIDNILVDSQGNKIRMNDLFL